MAYSSGQIATILLKADKTMYKIGDVAYDNMFSELDEAYDYERDIIFIYKKAVEYGDNYFVGTLKLDQIIERLAAKLNIYDYGILSPIYVDVYTQVDQGLNIIYVLKTTALDLGPGLTGDTDFSQSQIDIDLDYTYLNTVYVIDERSLTINGVTYDLSSNRSWSVNLQSITTQGATTTDKITVGGVGLTGMTAGSGALYYNAGSNRVTVANYNAGGSVYVEVNGGSYSAVFGPDLSFTSYGTIAGVFNNATVDTDRFLVSDGGVIKYRTGAQLLSDIGGQPSGNYVPYVGATQNVDLGEYEIKAGQFTLDVSPTGTATIGTTRWNNNIGSSETTLKGGSVILKNGVDLVARVVNKVFPNATLTKAQYQAVRVTGAQGQRLAVAYAQANNDNNSADTIGLVTETIPTNQEGFIMTVGSLEGINTTGSLQGETWSDGDVLYLSPTTPGALTNVKPVAPQHLVVIGYVEYAHANNGKIYVKVMNGWELGELHDVNTTGAVAGNVLKYNGTIWTPSSDIDTGITSLNGLTALSQTFATGTSGTDFNISSSTSTHTFNLPTASATNRGALSSSDWTTFNNKQNALTLTTIGSSGASTLVGATLNIPNYTISGLGGVPTTRTLTINGTSFDLSADRTWSVGTITSLTGEATASGTGAVAVTLTNSAVIGKVLTGLNLTGGGTILATDTILQAFGKVQNQISALVGGVMYQGVWDASTNTPTITSSVGTKGSYYVVSVAGSTNINGITDWKVGDWIIFNGSTWDKVDNTDAVSSVNGFTGAVNLTTANISEATNLYYTDARARAAISLTTTGSSGAATYSNLTGVLNVPQYTLGGLGGVPTSRTLTINGTAFDLSLDRSWSVGTVTSIATTGPITGGTITGSGTIGITQATSSTNGYLSSSDWTNFNNKQGAITLTTTGSSGSSTFIANILNIPTYTLSGLGGVPTTRTLTINGTAFDLSLDRSWSVGTVTSVAALTIGTTGTDITSTVANGTTTPVITLNIPTASATNRGALSAADWNTFNNKQNAITLTTTGTSGAATLVGSTLNIPQYQSVITNPVTGTGTTNYVTKWTSSSAVGNSQIFDNGTNIGIGTASPVVRLQVNAASTEVAQAFSIADTRYLQFYTDGSISAINSYNSSPLVFSTSTGTSFSERMRITSSGLVGINTSSPSFSLDVNGTSRSDIHIFRSNQSAPTADAFIFRPADNSIALGTANTERLRINASGNLGLGVTPSAWWSNIKTLELPNGAAVLATANVPSLTLTSNTYVNSSVQWIYQTNAQASRYEQYQGVHAWYTAPSGTAGSAITFTQAMTLNASGNLGLGTTGPVLRLDVQGNAADTATVSSTTVEQVTLFRPSNGVGGIRTGFNTTSGDAYVWSAQSGASLNFGTRSAPNNTAHLTIASSGAATFSSSVTANATSTFSNALGLSAIFSNGGAGANYNSIELRGGTAGTAVNWQISKDNTVASAFQITPSTTNGGTTYTTPAFTLTSAGAATFSSSVTATIFDSTSNAYRFNGNNALSLVSLGGQSVVKINAAGYWGTQLVGANDQGILINNSGQVGIGSTNPTVSLDVNGSGIRIINATAPNIYLNNTTVQWRTYLSGNDYRINDGASDLMSIVYGSGRVGIGTSSPAYKLDVFANNNASIAISESSDDPFIWFDRSDGGANRLAWRIRENASRVLVFETGSSASRYGQTFTEAMRITSGGLVGIGTTSPSALLHLNSGGTTNMYIQSGAGNGAVLRYFVGTSEAATARVDASANYYIETGLGGPTERMRITSGGNLLVGTTNDTGDRLYVNNTAYIGNASGGLKLFGDGGSATIWTGIASPLRLGANNTEFMRITSGGNVGIGTSSPINTGATIQTTGAAFSTTATKNSNMYGLTLVSTTNENTMSGVWFGSGGGVHWSGIAGSRSNYTVDWSTHLSFYTHIANTVNITDATEKMRITGDGNVGIGTTSPQNILHVQGTDSYVRISNPSTGNSGIKISYQNSDTHGLHLSYNPGSAISYIDNTYPISAGQVYGDIYFRQNVAGTMTSRIMIKADGGNVGIGTTNPTALLTLDSASEVRFRMNTGGTQQIIINHDQTSGIIRTESSTPLVLGTAATERMRITSGGNVGIGSTSPTSAISGSAKVLAIVDNTTANLSSVRVYGGSSTTSLELYGGGSQVGLYGSTAHPMVFSTNSTEAMRITSGGNVGIGTTSPTSLLHVNSGTTATQTVANFAAANYGSSSSRTYIQIGTQYGDGSSRIGSINTTGNQSALVFQTQSATSGVWNDAMYINGSANVGIGTTSPNVRLRVLGGSSTFQFALKLAKSSYADSGGHTTLIGLGCEDAAWSRSAIGHTRTTSYDAGYLGFYVSNNNSDSTELSASDLRMMINRDGNVGIGTTNPTEKLHVNGNIKTAAPTGYTAGSWKLGTANTGTVTANRYITIEIDGQIYTINALLGTP